MTTVANQLALGVDSTRRLSSFLKVTFQCFRPTHMKMSWMGLFLMQPATLHNMKLDDITSASLAGEVTTAGGKITLAAYKLSLAFLLLCFCHRKSETTKNNKKRPYPSNFGLKVLVLVTVAESERHTHSVKYVRMYDTFPIWDKDTKRNMKAK